MSQTIQQIYEQRVQAGDLQRDPAQEGALPELERIRSALAERKPASGLRGLFAKPPEPPRGLYMWGGVGRGKSMLMDLFHEAAPVPSRRVHFHAFMQEIHTGLARERDAGVDEPLSKIAKAVAKDVRLLCFDEMQITDITDAMIVGRLFDLLFEERVVVVTTSNRVPDDLYKDGLNRQLFRPFIDLIKERMVVHHLHSPVDYRQGRLTGTPVYFTPADAQARTAMDDIWHDLTGGEAAPLKLIVKKREVVLPAYRNGIARARFWDLCGTMLGPGDYLAVADAVKVLLLEDIPQLGRSNFNEAKRFVTLIDALYEAKVRLVASAAAPPEQLYVEGEGRFEFERTASRLREMQAADWGVDPEDIPI
ncbi:cell division protein ZapE [Aliiroseovarius sp. PTFE2010]|uniref:cell division protein ZapE n=1 Tax=Aliiroseovarius sp. PTFE2010 TaxID=3417190 RepID=UPI003CFB1B86